MNYNDEAMRLPWAVHTEKRGEKKDVTFHGVYAVGMQPGSGTLFYTYDDPIFMEHAVALHNQAVSDGRMPKGSCPTCDYYRKQAAEFLQECDSLKRRLAEVVRAATEQR